MSNRVLAYDTSRQLTAEELKLVAGGAATSTSVSGNGVTSCDTDDDTTGTSTTTTCPKDN